MEAYLKKHHLLYGVCAAGDFPELPQVLHQKNRALQGFAEQDVEKRISPELALPGVQSIVVLAMPYQKDLAFAPDGLARGIVSQSALGRDYHLLLREHLEAVARFLGLTEYRAFVDTGPLVDRAVALRAGLGHLGKNQSLITPLGSMVFLGYLLTTAQLAPTPPQTAGACGSCTACLRACPTGALSEAGFCLEKCVSYLTQKKGLLTLAEMAGMGEALYGCDACSLACPANRAFAGEPFEDQEAARPRLWEILELSEAGFRARFGATAAGWRGRRILQRNAVIALYHQGADISPCLTHPAQLVRDTARRLLGREDPEKEDGHGRLEHPGAAGQHSGRDH